LSALTNAFNEQLAEADRLSGKYEWMAAATSIQAAVERAGPETSREDLAGLLEALAKAYFKAAFQSRTREEFKERMKLSGSCYKKAQGLLEEVGKQGLANRARARELFTDFWTSEETEKRRAIMEEAIRVAEEASRSFGSLDSRAQLAETHRDLLEYYSEDFVLQKDWRELKELAKKAVSLCETTLQEYNSLGEENPVEVLNLAALLLSEARLGSAERSQYETLAKKAAPIMTRCEELSKKARTPLEKTLTNEASARIIDAFFLGGNIQKAEALFRTALSTAHETKDTYVIGRLLAALAVFSVGGGAEESADGRAKAFDDGVEICAQAIDRLLICYSAPNLGEASYGGGEAFVQRGLLLETEPSKKKTCMQKAAEITRKALPWANPNHLNGVQHTLSKALYFLATLETDPERKRELLKEALELRTEEAGAVELSLPPDHWYVGRAYNYLALIKAELSEIEEDMETKVDLLRAAVSDMEKCLSICSVYAKDTSVQASQVALYSEWYGDILVRLFRLTMESEWARSAAKNYQEAISYTVDSGQFGPEGPLRWKVARTYDSVGDFDNASKSFSLAAEDYTRGAEKIPSLAPVYRELASYMKSWALIEDARAHHDKEDYSTASEDYRQAASLLDSTNTWNILSRHYSACAFLEKGEALSREENPSSSRDSFVAAGREFESNLSELKGVLGKSLQGLPEEELERWKLIAQRREKYARARAALETAKILDTSGDEEGSATSYKSAAEIFGVLLKEGPTEQSKGELETLQLFSEAWARMKEAEVQASPQLYGEAAATFARAKNATLRKRFRLLAEANASICEALESSARFRKTHDSALYSKIKTQMQAAADCYQEAGFEKAAEWTRATQRLFDALAYTASAEGEMDARKKTEFYHLAEKQLGLAARLYEKVGFSKKHKEVLWHLERVREEKELLLTPMEAMADSSSITGAAVAPISLLRDQVVGLEKFEVANVVGNLAVHQKEIGVGSGFVLELEIANVGRTAATLVKLENLAPEGVEVDRSQMAQRLEDNYLDMKGRRLEYLKTLEVKVPMRAKRKGAFQLHPRVLFLDEKGNYRSCEFEPVSLSVNELGISGWLKGPR
jgi:hypothetical protein